jgi:signal transduction histidine kinase
MTISPHGVRSVARITAAGVGAAVLIGLAGIALERARLGATDEAALARIRAELDQRFEATAQALSTRAERVAAERDMIRGARQDSVLARRLFAALDRELPVDVTGTAGITVFDPAASPLAWVGEVTDLPRERIDGPSALFAAPDARGPRLIRVEPLPDTDRPSGPRLATVVVEQRVNVGAGFSGALADSLLLPTSVVDVAVRALPGSAGRPQSPYAFEIRSRDGQILAEAEVSPASLAATRARWRAWTQATVFSVLALTLLLCGAPILEWRRRVRTPRAVLTATGGLVAILIGARVLIWFALSPIIGRGLGEPLALLPNALFLGAGVWLAIDLLERRRVACPSPHLRPLGMATTALVMVGAFITAAMATGLVWSYERFLQTIAAQSSFDLLHFSLHPLEFARLSLAFGLVLTHAGIIWMAAAIMRAPAIFWRTERSASVRLLNIAAAIAGAATAIFFGRRSFAPIPIEPLIVAVATAGLAAAILSRPRGRIRRASQAARLGLLFLALLLPAIALYPAINRFAIASREETIAKEFAPQVVRQRDDLKLVRLPHALEAIDAMPSLADFVTSSSEDRAPTTDRAFIVWSQTELATYRTTSAVELYGPNGRLVSRFALILPEYGTTNDRAGSCDEWELYEEVSPFGSSLRPVLRASRAICENGRRVGAIVVRAMLDYRSLPFISSESPYVESLKVNTAVPPEGGFARDLEFAVYGWSRAPIYAPGTSVWPLTDEVFDAMVASRQPLWTTLRRDGDAFRVYFFNDSFAIYALGYPAISWLGHLINLGELVFLTGVLYLILLLGLALVRGLSSHTLTTGRALLREARSKFYRKLFIGFVASAVVPVIVLALATRTYLANQFRAGVEESAVKTATVAQRLVEDYAALQRGGANSLQAVDDQFMVLVRWAIDQDVNLFEGPRLQATSERDLFASHLLPSRTPSNVYRSIVLERLPTSVGVEDVGGRPYLLAAAPVRTGGREGIVTVPEPLRGQEIERQRDELDRRVLSASVLFVLLGAAFGYWIAERIADPVNRLTRATRRIARGDLDARIATSSSDELRGLVEDFNQMADDLKRQRANLERTQRLEAWADMARQVAHDIKNPLTPIQLSAEHARRVNLDRGSPLSPVLDECVNAILSQVKLLRQISAEFSSFASSPTPRPEPTNLADLIESVVEPYRIGLAGRIAVNVHTARDLPQLFIDRTLFARALTNVIENALHAMPGGGTLTVDSRHAVVDGQSSVVVEVRDTGEGMDEDARAKIFEPYFSTKATGTGLGLTIAKRNVELNGGTISVASERGVGTSVTIVLNAAQPAASQPS